MICMKAVVNHLCILDAVGISTISPTWMTVVPVASHRDKVVKFYLLLFLMKASCSYEIRKKIKLFLS